VRPAATGARRPAPTSTDYAALRRGLSAAGLDQDYFSHDDVMAMWRWGYSVDRIVAAAVQREQHAASRAS
jgi:hypothetical protein